MKHRKLFLNFLPAGLLCVFLFSSVAVAQGDPLALQQQAIRRIDAFIEHFRRTGDFRARVSDLRQAEGELALSNRMLAARGDWSALAHGLIKQGTTYRMQSQWPKAIALYQQAEEAAKRGRDVVRQADALAWKSLAESSRSNVGQALADASQAVTLAETTDDKDVLARALDVLASAQIGQRNLAAAADTLNREVAAASQAKEPLAMYYAYLNRSDIYMKSGERCDFQRTFEPCYQALDRAHDDLLQALSITRRLGYAGLSRQTEEFIGNVAALRTLIKSQEQMHRTMQKNAVFRPKLPSDVLVSDRFVPEPGEIPPLLTQLYESSKRVKQQAGGFSDVVEAQNHFVDGMMNQMQGNNDAALALFLKAVEMLERDRRALPDERSRGTFLEDRIGFYYLPIQLLLERRRYADAFELLERSRSRALADLLASRKLGLERSEEQELYARLTMLRTQIADTQSELFESVSQPDAAKKGAQIVSLQGKIRSLEAQHQQVISRMTTEAPRLQNLVVSAPASLKALQQSMREERYEVLQYLVLEHGLILWHIAPDSVFVRNVFLPRSEVMGKVAALQKSLSDHRAPFDETTARELFLFLIQPALSRIRTERLVIIPHEDLSYVPFQVLQDPANGRYLGDRFQVTYAPSVSILLGLKRAPGISGGRLLAVGDPDLVSVRSEVEAIAKLFPGRSQVVIDELAREKDIKVWLRDFDVIHLAVHGNFDAGEPMLSYLTLARGAGEDGKLTAAEMFGLALDKSRLVVLSGCETGRAEATHGNEILGMVRALMYAGAGTLVLSHWKVDSEATALWMQTFYETAVSGSIPEAARAALVKVKSSPAYSHPYYWAAFTIIGR
jgi:CHAT domain-containing protein